MISLGGLPRIVKCYTPPHSSPSPWHFSSVASSMAWGSGYWVAGASSLAWEASHWVLVWSKSQRPMLWITDSSYFCDYYRTNDLKIWFLPILAEPNFNFLFGRTWMKLEGKFLLLFCTLKWITQSKHLVCWLGAHITVSESEKLLCCEYLAIVTCWSKKAPVPMRFRHHFICYLILGHSFEDG